jgi:hypothetical protein
MNTFVPKAQVVRLFQAAIGGEILTGILFLLLVQVGGFIPDNVKYLGLVMVPAKTFYVSLFLLYLMRYQQDLVVAYRSGFASLLRSGLWAHAIIAALSIVLTAIGGIISFQIFLLFIFIVESLFVLFLTLALPSLFSPSEYEAFNPVESTVRNAELSMPPEGATETEKVIFFLKTGQTARALSIMDTQFMDRPEEKHSVVLLSGELATLEIELQRGQISVNDAKTQLNRIRHVALNLAGKIQKKPG